MTTRAHANKVLVIEDDQEVARQVATILRQALYVVDVAHDGREGQFLGDTEPYDAVVLDLATGTLAEIAMVWEFMCKGFIPKAPLILLDFWQPLFATLVPTPDIKAASDGYVQLAKSPEEAVEWVDKLLGNESALA